MCVQPSVTTYKKSTVPGKYKARSHNVHNPINKQQKLLSLRFLLRPFMFGPQIQGPAIANKVTPKALSITNEFPKNFMQRGDKRLHPKCSKTNLSKLDSGALCSLLTQPPILTFDLQVILKIRKIKFFNAFASKKESKYFSLIFLFPHTII